MKNLVLPLFILVFMLSSFVPFRDNCRRSGIKGRVLLVTGNQMPSPGEPRPAPKGIKTTVYIYELTNTGQVTKSGAFYSAISTKPVKQVETADDGSFKVKLKPGQYSLFVKKGALFYSNIFDAENNIHPVTVAKGVMTEEEFRVDYDAAY